MHRRAFAVCLTLAALAAACARPPARPAPPNAAAAPACPADVALSARLQRVVDSLAALRPDVHGVALAVHAPARCARGALFARAFAAGVADPGAGLALAPNAPVRMASNMKTYVAAAVLRLVEDGRVGIDDPIARHVSAEHAALLRRGRYDPEAITVRLLLGHTGGVYDHTTHPSYFARIEADPTHRWTRTEQLQLAADSGAAYGAPGAVFRYSDTGYVLLGELLERATGRPLGAALRQLLDFERLGLRETWHESLEPAPAGLAPRAHQFAGARDTYTWDPSIDLYGGGGLAATVGDMARFTRALLQGRVFRRPETLALMQTNVRPAMLGRGRDYRLGVYAQDVAGERAWGHSGYWNTFSYHLPASDVTVAGAVLQNRAGDVAAALAREAVLAARGPSAEGGR